MTGTNGIVAEVVGSCGETFSYMINGHDAIYQGEGHWHDSGLSETFPFAASTRYDGTSNLSGTHCEFSLKIIATEEFQRTYYTSGPAIFAAVVVLTFLFTACVFALYDWMVFRRQTKLLNTAERTNAIVSSLFPKDVRDRIMAEAEEQARQEQSNPMKGFRQTAKNQLKGFLNEEDEEVSTESIFKTKPIADLFPEVTVMFADLVGFTAWSSMREPAQVFMLLETIYHEFDQIAKRRRVFKVETVGDCYVAVSGLPEPRKDHAVVMVSVSGALLNQVAGNQVHSAHASNLVFLLGSLCTRLSLQDAYLGATVGDYARPRHSGLGATLWFAFRPRDRWCPSRRARSLPAFWRYDEHNSSC